MAHETVYNIHQHALCPDKSVGTGALLRYRPSLTFFRKQRCTRSNKENQNSFLSTNFNTLRFPTCSAVRAVARSLFISLIRDFSIWQCCGSRLGFSARWRHVPLSSLKMEAIFGFENRKPIKQWYDFMSTNNVSLCLSPCLIFENLQLILIIFNIPYQRQI